MAVGDAYVFPGFLSPVLTQLFFPKPPTTFPTCFCRGERRKYAGKKSRLNRGSNSQPPGHESDTLTIEPPRRGSYQRTGAQCYKYPLQQDLFLSDTCPLFQRLLCGKAASGSERILCGVLIKRTPGMHRQVHLPSRYTKIMLKTALYTIKSIIQHHGWVIYC